MRFIRSFLSRLTGLAATVAAVAMVVMLVHIMIDVGSDFLFDRPLSGTTEFTAYYYMVALVFLAFPYVQNNRGHLQVEAFTGALRPRTRQLLDAVGQLALFAFLALIAWLTTEEAIRRTVNVEMVEAGITPVVVWPSRWLLPVGAALMAAVSLVQAIDGFSGASEEDDEDGAHSHAGGRHE